MTGLAVFILWKIKYYIISMYQGVFNLYMVTTPGKPISAEK